MTKTTPTSEDYNADSLITLDPMAYIQKRPSLSLGPHERMQLVALREPIDNGIDEFRAGHGKSVKVTIFSDGAAQIEDSGRGVPTGINAQTGENGIYMAFGKVGSGGKFGAADSGYSGTASLGTNGVGTSAVNATSVRFDTLVYKSGKITRLSFKNGKPGRFADDSGPDATFTAGMDVWEEKDDRSPAEKKARPTGTTIKFWPNKAIFGHDSTYRVDELREVLRSSAFLIPGLHIVIDDQTPGQEQFDEYEFDGGFVDMIDAFSTDIALHAPIHLETSGHFKETIPMPQKDGSVRQEEVERHVKIDAVLRWGEGYDTNIRSYVNTIYTSLGGVHVQGLERALSKVIVDYIKGTRGLLKPKEEAPILADIEEGLTAIISVEQNEAKFTSQDKTKLSGAETGKVVSAALTESLKQWFDNKKNINTVKLIAQHVVDASRVRLAARAQKDVARKQTALESSSSMPAKLVACSSKDSSITELQICEGDSALGGLKLSRSSAFQAIYPLKGKPLNVFNATLAKVLENQEWADLIQIIGAGIGRTFDIETMRYKRIILLADADPDGNHIAVLLTSFFWKYMRPLIEDGRLYIALPPLFSITPTGKNKERFYALNKEELDKLVKRLASQGKKYEKIQRHKGLGEYSPDILAEVVMNPTTRILRQVTSDNVKEIERILELTMGANASDRRDWIVENRDLISEEELDVG
jgi:DNA gyrase subunit B